MQPRVVETMAQVPPGTRAEDGGQTQGLHGTPVREIQGDGEVGAGLQARVRLIPASNWLGLEQGMSGDIHPVFILQ